MDINLIPPGDNPPDNINVLVEIPQGGLIKYEFDKQTGALFVDRFLATEMVYPGNYGFIPQTLADDGDPLDVLIISPASVMPGAVVRCRPVGVLKMEDEQGGDDKIVAVPFGWAEPRDLTPTMRNRIAHFFEHYKDLEPGKWVRIIGWGEVAEAADLITAALNRAGDHSH
ncbi:MAG: inorganic diphosphatase [Alphaproteobacteria bacterium]|nr:inorganic diphosphatase [Alphaproteobacteria bacterium]